MPRRRGVHAGSRSAAGLSWSDGAGEGAVPEAGGEEPPLRPAVASRRAPGDRLPADRHRAAAGRPRAHGRVRSVAPGGPGLGSHPDGRTGRPTRTAGPAGRPADALASAPTQTAARPAPPGQSAGRKGRPGSSRRSRRREGSPWPVPASACTHSRPGATRPPLNGAGLRPAPPWTPAAPTPRPTARRPAVGPQRAPRHHRTSTRRCRSVRRRPGVFRCRTVTRRRTATRSPGTGRRTAARGKEVTKRAAPATATRRRTPSSSGSS